ncbi:hypothetical protein QR680_007881 [Steinernema hermaphroditum]|uniref:Uncharacterized protein n=1 Tax=Steinernema hermaphroditum TaxID=289476 RepID=A0AA39IGR0_9BILA|nr:hypothetical protein QR680_007881 [Steinernema hermaphroditum]
MHHFDKQENVVVRVFFSLLVFVVVVAARDHAIQDFSFYCSTVIVGSIALLCLFIGVASDASVSVDLILFYSAYELFMILISIIGIVSFHLDLPYSIDSEVFAVVLFIRLMLLIYFLAFALHKVERRERRTHHPVVAVDVRR